MMHIHIPKELQEIEGLEDSLHLFVTLMVRKLHLNRHKGFLEGKSVLDMVNGFYRELREVESALINESQFDIALESVDVANMGFLLALMCLHLPKNEFEEHRKSVINFFAKREGVDSEFNASKITKA